MAWQVKYRHQFRDRLDVIWTTNIYAQDWAGAITILTGSGNPLTFEFYGDDDIFEQNILGSKMSLEIIVNSNFTYSELFTSDNLKFKVVVSHGTIDYWSGYILADNYQEPYDHLPILVTLVATDGLGLLKDFKFVNLGYTARVRIFTVIYDMLSLVGITSFTEYVNLYEDSMDLAVGNSPLDQIGIDPELHKESSCYEALEDILKMLNAGIRQDLNIITIFRFVEIKGATMYGRIFTSGTPGHVETPITKNPLQYLKRAAQSSNFWDYSGGTLMITPQAKTYILNYDLGLRESTLKNWEFKFDDFVLTEGEYTIPYWYLGSLQGFGFIYPMSIKGITGEDKGIYLDRYTTSLPPGAYGGFIEQKLTGVKTRSPNFKLSFDTKIYHSVLDAAYYIYYFVYVVGATTKYWNGETLLWQDSVPSVNNTPKVLFKNTGDLDWQVNDTEIKSIPIDGDLYVRFFSLYSSINTPVRVAYRNVKLVMTPIEGSEETGIGYTTSAAPTGRIIEKDMNLGDGFTVARYTVNQLLNYNGIINCYSGVNIIDPGNTWFTRGNVQNVALLALISSELGAQYVRQKHTIDLPLREMEASSFLSLTGNIKDVVNMYESVVRTFAISQGSYNVRMREWNLTLNEIL